MELRLRDSSSAAQPFTHPPFCLVTVEASAVIPQPLFWLKGGNKCKTSLLSTPFNLAYKQIEIANFDQLQSTVLFKKCSVQIIFATNGTTYLLTDEKSPNAADIFGLSSQFPGIQGKLLHHSCGLCGCTH